MTKYFFDTSTLIYALELDSKNAQEYIQNAVNDGHVGISAAAVMEYCAGCYIQKKPEMIDIFTDFIRTCGFEIRSVDREAALCAAKIRGMFPSIKSLDAIHLACAKVSGADYFCTNDLKLLQYSDPDLKIIRVEA